MAPDSGGAERHPDALAPVIPLFGGGGTNEWDRTWIADPAVRDVGPEAEEAEKAVLRKLRARPLSVSEARRILRERELDDAGADDIVARLVRHGYLDDHRLAEQLAQAAVTRKGQGRRAVALALSARGIDREAVDAAIALLPDDEDERALDVARSRAHRVGDDPQAALRRLVGQLTRRGFSASVAMSAARTALDERR